LRLRPHRPSRFHTTVAVTDSSSRLSISVEPALGSAGPSIIAPASDKLRILTGAETVPAEIDAASMTFLRGGRGFMPGRVSAERPDVSSTAASSLPATLRTCASPNRRAFGPNGVVTISYTARAQEIVTR